MPSNLNDALKDSLLKITSSEKHRVLFCVSKIYSERAEPLATNSYVIDSLFGELGGGLDDIGLLDNEDVPGHGIYIWEGTVAQDIEFFDVKLKKSVGFTKFIISPDQDAHGDDADDLEFDGSIRKISDPKEYESLMSMEPTKIPIPGPVSE